MTFPIRRALLSVSDKSGLVDFATELNKTFGVELIATGGTRQALIAAGLPVKDVAEVTGFPEILDGRVKTLHPAIFAGILAKRDQPDHLRTLGEHSLPVIDMVVCNLYPFEDVVAKPGTTEAVAIENIDIGGPSMVRAAAKNYAAVAVAVEPETYPEILLEMKNGDGQLSLEFRKALAAAAFQRVANYDAAIEAYFLGMLPEEDETTEETWADEFDPPFNLKQTLRYGENPHQEAAFYIEPELDRPCIASAEQLHGKELSYNNILDLDSAFNIVREFIEPVAVVVKHNNPCGAAIAPTLAEAFDRAWAGDPQSAFGGILAFNQEVDAATAEAITMGERFVECVIAPSYQPDALKLLSEWKKNVRILRTGAFAGPPEGLDYRRVDGGLLVQTRDIEADDFSEWKVPTHRAPTPEELEGLKFAWLICKHVKSNAIVLARAGLSGVCSVAGVGAGQMSRIDSVKIAVRKAGDAKGTVLASDAFFPFRDNVDFAAAAGITAIAQPGGSQRDAESIAACDEAGIAMVFTGIRHFRH